MERNYVFKKAGTYWCGMCRAYFTVFKRGLHDVHHVRVKHLGHYVNEFAFRLNEGNCEVDTIDRLDALFGAMPGKIRTYRELVGKV